MKTEDLWPEIKWCIKNAQIIDEYRGVKFLKIAITEKPMRSRLKLFFSKNYSNKSKWSWTIRINEGSINLHWESIGKNRVLFTAALSNEYFSSIEN